MPARFAIPGMVPPESRQHFEDTRMPAFLQDVPWTGPFRDKPGQMGLGTAPKNRLGIRT